MEKVKSKIKIAFPGIAVELVASGSRGDALQDVPLQTVEGSDFFTQEIFEKLTTGEADIAVHSLKDMSSEHFFGKNIFAVVERDDPRDVAIFNRNVLNKIKAGEPVVIGTCSPRREEMATEFLQKALPQLSKHVGIKTEIIRGNVDTRLKKLNRNEYDGIILAVAGLNRLLSSKEDTEGTKALLKDKLLMVLPLVECVPAPCQGAIVAEADPSNKKAKEILERINDVELMNDCIQEKKIAAQYGKGCLQKFGVTTINYDGKKVRYAAGKDSNENTFSKWYGLPDLDGIDKSVFSTTEFMGRFFNYEYFNTDYLIKQPVVYVSNYKAIKQQALIENLQDKRVWAAGTKTWFDLSKSGIWVEGSADALGLESLRSLFSMPLLDILPRDVCVITSKQAAQAWRKKGWYAIATYSLTGKHMEELKTTISNADIIFWTSFRQYEQYRNILRENVTHSCPAGETAELLREAGIEPVVFPTIKSFQQWRSFSTRSHSVA